MIEPMGDEVEMEFAESGPDLNTPSNEAALQILALGYKGALRKISNEISNLRSLVGGELDQETLIREAIERANQDVKLSSNEYEEAVSIIDSFLQSEDN